MNYKDLVIAKDGQGFDVLLNADDNGGYVSCGEEVREIGALTARALSAWKGAPRMRILAKLFGYSDFTPA